MRLSIDDLKAKCHLSGTDHSIAIEVLASEDTSLLRGGDREPTKPVYQFEHQSIWEKASMLLDNIR
ncbi:MAG TPA: hypothetical protein VGN64_14495 [Dyadobacter sp.]|jgi:hypothetical protein|uniref:Uncharacterized protein n=1 Tax=Dyadobacter luteus TaxID=2259619 RepID=A0A3D8YIN1_9BACT|nr:hypothetical protein [Dyadobacter luteus]REA63540.1 hypothetical protein DSL64_03600 [Dyadobacter luteus]HEV7381005.1 hypothetical protein [Dyadobacter sp.]